jgi:hypothetical protein
VTRLALSPAATALLRLLIARAGVPRDRILLSEWCSVDWQSLTFIGERHEIAIRIAGPESLKAALRLTDGLADAEFDLGAHVVADIAAIGAPSEQPDGSTTLQIEALTIAA